MTAIFQVSVSGAKQRPVDQTVFSLLEQLDGEILDLGQVSIHQRLNLVVLVKLPKAGVDEFSSRWQKFVEHNADFSCECREVTAEQYQKWAAHQGVPHHIITVLASRIDAGMMARLTEVIVESGLVIGQIHRLSERVGLEQKLDLRSCFEITVRGHVESESQLRAALMKVADDMSIDIAVQMDNAFRRSRRLAVFDMDSTLIQAEVIDELAKHAGVGEQVAAITERTMRGELDFTQSFTERLSLLEGLDESVLQKVAGSLKLTDGCERLMLCLRRLGYKTAIVSGGFNYFGQYLQQKLGFDYVFANELEIVDGKVTGRVSGKVVDGQRKAELLKQIARDEGLQLDQVVAVGDGANDLPMLGIAGLGVAFHAKPLVKANAKQAINQLGLDAILYMMGLRDRDIDQLLLD